jgi:hypothetical protein
MVQDPVQRAIRAAITKELLSVARGWGPERFAAIEAAVGREALAVFDNTAAIGWSDFAPHMRLSDAIRQQTGSAGNVETWFSVFDQVCKRPLLRPFFAALFRLTRSPAGVFKTGPRVHAMTHRGLGAYLFELEPSGRGAIVQLDQFPSPEFSLDTYAEGMLGAMRCVMTMTGSGGTVDLGDMDAARGFAEYTLRWP